MHTAVKMAPEYDGLVVHSTDASRNMQIITSLTSPTARVFAAGILADQKRLRELYASAQDRRPLADYRERLAEAEFQRQLSPAASEEKVREGEHQHKLKSEPERSFLAAAEGVIAFANAYAPEHLIISMRDPWAIAEQITAAGSVFIGNYSPESAGDYASGTNHTLPTTGLARAWSGIGLDSFMHSITYQELTREGLQSLGKTIITMAEAEGLDAHAAAVKTRLE